MAVEEDRSDARLEETKRVARILHIVQLIGAQPQSWTRRKLATEFELSERMIANDLEIIRHRLCYALHRTRRGYYFQACDGLRART